MPSFQDWGKRVLTVVCLVPAVLWLLQSPVLTMGLIAVVQAFCLHEYQATISPRIISKTGANHSEYTKSITDYLILQLIGCGCIVGSLYDHKLYAAISCAGIALIIVCSLLKFFQVDAKEQQIIYPDVKSIMALCLDIFAVVTIINCFSYAVLIRSLSPYGFGFQLLGLLCMWNTDNGALVVGSMIGGRKLIPAISPGKTVAGAIGGISWSIATSVTMFKMMNYGIFPSTFLPSVSVSDQIFLGFTLGTAAVFGDLTESLLKRVAQVKDSGTLFPGHGGALDRMDSLLYVSPLLFHYSTYLSNSQ